MALDNRLDELERAAVEANGVQDEALGLDDEVADAWSQYAPAAILSQISLSQSEEEGRGGISFDGTVGIPRKRNSARHWYCRAKSRNLGADMG
ncbi:MAG: hypothetical protein F4X12_19040 [Acidobacteriia bacterium]|nr:hypothetical protein [Terriglobia bacterium]